MLIKMIKENVQYWMEEFYRFWMKKIGKNKSEKKFVQSILNVNFNKKSLKPYSIKNTLVCCNVTRTQKKKQQKIHNTHLIK